MRLRVIDFGEVPAVRSLAGCYGVLDLMTEGDAPALVLASASEPYMCIGCHQDAGREIDEPYCRAQGIAILRRRLGGGAIYIDSRQMIFHFLFPATRMPKQPARLQALFAEPVVLTYRDFGLPALYRAPGDIAVDGRKIGGIAAALDEHAAIVGGTFLFDIDTAVMARCLKVPSEDFRTALAASLADGITSLAKLLPRAPTRAALKERFLANAGACLGVEPWETTASAAEQAAGAAAAAVLGSDAWSTRCGRKFVARGTKIAAGKHLTERSFATPAGAVRVRLGERDGCIASLAIDGDGAAAAGSWLARLSEGLLGAHLDESALSAAAARVMATHQWQLQAMSPGALAIAILATCHRDI
ncbi:MAG: biotin/lipoate A/B protein ligase family protein [Alphaproteobacteria bacterium]